MPELVPLKPKCRMPKYIMTVAAGHRQAGFHLSLLGVAEKHDVLNPQDRSLGSNGGGARPLTPEHGPPAELGEKVPRRQGQTRGPGRRANAPNLRAPVRSATRVIPAAHQPSGRRAEKGCSPPQGGAQPDKAGTDRGRASELNAFRRTPPAVS